MQSLYLRPIYAKMGFLMFFKLPISLKMYLFWRRPVIHGQRTGAGCCRWLYDGRGTFEDVFYGFFDEFVLAALVSFGDAFDIFYIIAFITFGQPEINKLLIKSAITDIERNRVLKNKLESGNNRVHLIVVESSAIEQFQDLGCLRLIDMYDVCTFKIVENHLGKDEFHFDCSLFMYGWSTILVRTEIYAMNH